MTEPAPETSPAGADEARRLLVDGEISVVGRLVEASNATLYCRLEGDGLQVACVYKPVAGERPLWDFPDGTLARRERAAYVLSESTGWGIVPPTVLRDGPLGSGMVQLWVDAVGDELVDVVPRDAVSDGWLVVLDALDGRGAPVVLVHRDDPRLRRMALFDIVVNNADRKGGHLLPQSDGHLYGVDHGVTFHPENKLRTVLWGFAGSPLEPAEREVLGCLAESLRPGHDLRERLADLLAPGEIDATLSRVDRVSGRGRFPRPGRHWPAIPWPAF